jgi:hypothetical protein
MKLPDQAEFTRGFNVFSSGLVARCIVLVLVLVLENP